MDVDERLSTSINGVMDIDEEIDNLCKSFDMMKGVHSKEEAQNSLEYSNRLGFYYLRDDFSWIKASSFFKASCHKRFLHTRFFSTYQFV